MQGNAQINQERQCAVDARVVRHQSVCREHVAITLELHRFPPSVPGQFLLLQCHDAHERVPNCVDWREGDRLALARNALRGVYLRRPFSIADRVDFDGGATHLLVLSREVGRGTSWLDGLRVGDTVNVTGPLGQGYEFPAQELPVILCGGGVGIPPLLYASHVLAERQYSRVALVVGAMSADLLPIEITSAPSSTGEPFACAALPGGESRGVVVATDDGTLGFRGRVTDALEPMLKKPQFEGAVVLACGPEPMLAAVARLTRRMNVACQVCIERFMACGLGTCLSCVVRTKRDQAAGGWGWSQACQDGPVYDRDAVLDYQ